MLHYAHFTGNFHIMQGLSQVPMKLNAACSKLPAIFYTRKDKLSVKSKKGRELKMAYNANKSIGCTVQQCEFHCQQENYCSLPKIQIGTHEQNPTMCQCTDCQSFKVKK